LENGATQHQHLARSASPAQKWCCRGNANLNSDNILEQKEKINMKKSSSHKTNEHRNDANGTPLLPSWNVHTSIHSSYTN
jgi:hypothetical protein